MCKDKDMARRAKEASDSGGRCRILEEEVPVISRDGIRQPRRLIRGISVCIYGAGRSWFCYETRSGSDRRGISRRWKEGTVFIHSSLILVVARQVAAGLAAMAGERRGMGLARYC